MRGVGRFGLVIAAACSANGSPNAEQPDASTDHPADCTADPRVDAYMPHLTKPGDNGLLNFELVEVTPAPPALGNNTFVVRIGSLIDGGLPNLMLRADLTMPDVGRSTPTDPTITFDAAAATYTIAPLNMDMAGLWRTEFDASIGDDAGITEDVVSFYFCIQP
jgi:hypothetical protein